MRGVSAKRKTCTPFPFLLIVADGPRILIWCDLTHPCSGNKQVNWSEMQNELE
jgi:hypothetical protein